MKIYRENAADMINRASSSTRLDTCINNAFVLFASLAASQINKITKMLLQHVKSPSTAIKAHETSFQTKEGTVSCFQFIPLFTWLSNISLINHSFSLCNYAVKTLNCWYFENLVHSERGGALYSCWAFPVECSPRGIKYSRSVAVLKNDLKPYLVTLTSMSSLPFHVLSYSCCNVVG